MSASESPRAPLQPSGGTQNYKTHIEIKSQEKKIMKYVCVFNIECLTIVLPKFTDAITSIRTCLRIKLKLCRMTIHNLAKSYLQNIKVDIRFH